VSAGYAPISIETETDGSLVCPAGRAASYTMEPTIGLVPQAGVVPVSANFDSAGPMTKIVVDLAVLLDAITARGVTDTYNVSLTGSWSDISVATVDPEVWKFSSFLVKPVEEATLKTVSYLSISHGRILLLNKLKNREIEGAYEKIKPSVKLLVENIPLISVASSNKVGRTARSQSHLSGLPKAFVSAGRG